MVVKVQKKRKRRYSPGLGDVQKSSRGLTKASRRLVRAVARGMATYLKESDKSARKRRDGAIRDFGLNVADALGTGVRASSGIPADLPRTLTPPHCRPSVPRSLSPP